MIAGRVLGQVWATKRAPGLAGQRMLLVAVEGADRVVVALDVLDARVGQRVLVALGSGARRVLLPEGDTGALLADAAIALLVDGRSDEPAEPPSTIAPPTEAHESTIGGSPKGSNAC